MSVDVDYARWFPADLRGAPVWEQDCFGDVTTRVARRSVEDATRTCVVLHGAGGNGGLMAPLLVGLQRAGIDAVAPDLPGYGRSSAPNARFTYDTWVAYAKDLAEREAARRGRPVALAGLSIGGMLAYHAASQTDAVDRIAVTNLLDTRRPEVRRGVARVPALGRLSGLMIPALDGLRLPIRWLANMRAVANDPTFAKACASDPRGGGAVVPLRFLRTWFGYEPPVEPEAFTKPVLYLHPGADRWTPLSLSQPFYDRLGGPKRLVVLENCGHAPVEEPGITTLRRELTAFLNE